ncbi:MAG: HlyD family efflux transporter periplasmic adaptor subunit [Phycisphaerae bacterium]|jgi:RND family efflux transporter MFP subunit|nr:HlyD family efflux transporter periplasmic adaptor subunit [Phycisphaerae bacterium]
MPEAMSGHRNVFIMIATRLAVCVVLLAAALGIFAWLVSSRPQAAESDRANQLRRVTVIDVIEAPVGRRVRGYGTARALESADVPARVGATIVELGAKYREGECVSTGELLVRLDDADFRRQLEMATQAIDSIDAQLAMLDVDERTAAESLRLAEADAAIVRADVARAEEAARDGAAKEREVDRVRQASIGAERAVVMAREASEKMKPRRASLLADRARQEASRHLAHDSLDRCTIRSPMNGVVQNADKEIGEMVTVGMQVARVVDPAKIEIPALLPASTRPLVGVGNVVLLTPDRDGAKSVEAKLTRIAPEDDPSTRTYTVYVEFAATEAIAPGTFIEVSVMCPASEPRTVLPRRAISEGRVLVVRDGRVHVTPVEVEFALTGLQPQSGLPDSEWIVLREDLPHGSKVVLDASRQIPDGTAILALPPTGKAEGESDAGAASLGSAR